MNSIVYWITYEKEGELFTIAVEAFNAEGAALNLNSRRGIDPQKMWNIVEACNGEVFKVYQEHTKGRLTAYPLGTRMLIRQIEHQKKMCETFAYANRSANRPYSDRWLPY